MKNLRKLVVVTAFGVLTAAPTLAQTTSDTAMIDIQAAISAVPDGASNLGTGPGQSVTAQSEAFVGNTVVSSEGEMLGTVTGAATHESGTTILLVDLDQEIGATADNLQVMLAAGEVSDGQVELIWPKAEILGALDAQTDAGGAATNESN